MSPWPTLWNSLIVLWLAWCIQAILAVLQARKFSRRIDRPVREGVADHQPKAAVIVPFKGYDADLAGHVRALLHQQYTQYRLVFVLESEDDPALDHIQLELAQHPHAPEPDLVFAGPAPAGTGQKVHNQLAALAHLDRQGDDCELWVFADSDAKPGPAWLQKLAGPHAMPKRVGVTTGYRWLMPELRAQRPRTASMFASVINSSVAMFIVHGKLTQAWGGSMAVRADFAREHGLTDYFKGALSDDYQMTRMARDGGKLVYFVPQCLVPSSIDLGWRELAEFGRRQYLITRVHDPALFAKALTAIGLYVAGAASSLGAVTATLILGGPWKVTGFAVAAMLLVGVANQQRAFYRRQAVAAAFGRDHLRYLRHTLRLDRYVTWLVMLVNLYLLLSALTGRTMTWRGKRYRLRGPQDIQQLNR